MESFTVSVVTSAQSVSLLNSGEVPSWRKQSEFVDSGRHRGVRTGRELVEQVRGSSRSAVEQSAVVELFAVNASQELFSTSPPERRREEAVDPSEAAYDWLGERSAI